MATEPRAGLHPLHQVWRALPAGLRRGAWRQANAWLAPRPDRPPPPATGGIGVGGEFARASGLGQGARVMAAALGALGVPHWEFEAGLALPGAALPEVCLPPPGVPLVLHVNGDVLPAALRALPPGALRGRRIIGYWAWELPVPPPGWRAGARFVHEIWAPSRFTAAALEPLLPGRVRVVPHPVAALPPCPSALTRADFGIPDACFVVLTAFSLASSFARKNPLAAIAAFRLAFGNDTRRRMIVKLSHVDHWPRDLARLKEAAEAAPNIVFETRTLPKPDHDALTACADAVLSLHRSEGFGLVPAEAMLLGRPVVATDWSATAEFLDAGCGCPVPYRLIPAADPRGVFEAPGASWADADIGAAAAQLRRLAENPALCRALGAAARDRATAQFGAAGLGPALAGLPLQAEGAAP